MRPCFAIEITTPKKFVLNGLWFGPKKPKRIIVWVHGLGGSLFSNASIVERLVDHDTAVVTFNNRGHDKIASVPRADGTRIKGGAAHEIFTDCVDDVQGAINFIRRQGIKSIYLAGQSTGCQKSIYWASQKGRGVKGIILFAPISDYSAFRVEYETKKISRAVAHARRLIREGKRDELLPSHVWGWPWIADAQRIISLCAGTGPEEIFTYWDEGQIPTTLRKIRIPILVLLAQKDEFADRSAKNIVAWFERNIKSKHRVVIVPNVGHGFKGGEKTAASAVREFMK